MTDKENYNLDKQKAHELALSALPKFLKVTDEEIDTFINGAVRDSQEVTEKVYNTYEKLEIRFYDEILNKKLKKEDATSSRK